MLALHLCIIKTKQTTKDLTSCTSNQRDFLINTSIAILNLANGSVLHLMKEWFGRFPDFVVLGTRALILSFKQTMLLMYMIYWT